VHATEAKIFNPVVTKLMDLVKPIRAAGGQVRGAGWSSHRRDDDRRQVHEHGGRAAWVGPRGIEWSDVDAKCRALMPDSKLPGRRIEEILSDPRLRAREERVGAITLARGTVRLAGRPTRFLFVRSVCL
jgi:hypothetical protein